LFSVFLFFILGLIQLNLYAPIASYGSEVFTEKEVNLVYAIDHIQIKVIETNGLKNAVSIAGARGDFQIMPISLADWNQQHPNEVYSMEDLFNSRINMKIGRWLLEDRIPLILETHKVPITINHILISYNWGCGNMIDWYKRGAKIKNLPNETQQYICKYWAKF
jgi:hypothetical protein